MRIAKQIGCETFPCADVRHEYYVIPNADIRPEKVKVVMISEAAPPDRSDFYYAPGEPLFVRTTLMAFRAAGARVTTMQELLDLGVYLTCAVKCGKIGYGIKAVTIKECSHILEREIDLFPNVKAWMLMGDVAIKAINYISKRSGVGRAIPAGSTYKIRSGEHSFRDGRAFPSYLQVGPSLGIEKSKQRMIAEDIAAALKLVE